MVAVVAVNTLVTFGAKVDVARAIEKLFAAIDDDQIFVGRIVSTSAFRDG